MAFSPAIELCPLLIMLLLDHKSQINLKFRLFKNPKLQHFFNRKCYQSGWSLHRKSPYFKEVSSMAILTRYKQRRASRLVCIQYITLP